MIQAKRYYTRVMRWTKWFRAYIGFCWRALKEEYEPSGGLKLMKRVYAVLAFIVLTFFGLGIVTVLKFLYPLLHKLAWLSIGLGIAITTLLVTIEAIRRFHERTVKEMREEHEGTVKEMRAEYATRSKRLYELSFINGHAAQIDLLFQKIETAPPNVLRDWGARLRTALHDCYGSTGEAVFYRGNETELKVPESIANHHVWFQSHWNRLSQLITEQLQEQSIVRSGETRK